MSLRSRLIIAFLLLSVVPLSAVTLLSYLSSVRAFELAAQHEATESAIEVSRRMEMITSDLARRMDRLFATGTAGSSGSSTPDPQMVRQTVAPVLGDSAALVDRMEFHPAPDAPAAPAPAAVSSDPNSVPIPIPPQRGGGGRRRGGFGGGPPRTPGAPNPPGMGVPPGPPPPGSQVIIMDIPRIVAEATRAASDAGVTAADDPKVRALIDKQIEQQLAANQQGLKAMAEALSREAAARSSGDRTAVDVQGRKIEVEVQKDGRVIGHANAMLNLDRMLRGVLGFARRDQGEIPFAIDRQGALYTPEASDKSRLEALGVERTAAVAASGTPRRSGDWIIVSRRAPSGIIFGIARPVGASLREIRRASVRNLGLGLMVIALALVGIIPISHRMTQHLATLTRGVHQLSGGDFSDTRAGPFVGRVRGAGRRVQPDGRRSRAPRSGRRRAGTAAEGTRAVAADPDRDAAAWVAALRGRQKSPACRFPRAKSAAISSTISCCPTVASRCSWATCQGRASAQRCSWRTSRPRCAPDCRTKPTSRPLPIGWTAKLDQNTPGGVYLTLFLAILDIEAACCDTSTPATIRSSCCTARPGFPRWPRPACRSPRMRAMAIRRRASNSPQAISLFFYTDGLVETENEQKEMFGAERLEAILERVRTDGIDTILQTVEESVKAFRGSAEPFDDATMMALRIS